MSKGFEGNVTLLYNFGFCFSHISQSLEVLEINNYLLKGEGLKNIKFFVTASLALVRESFSGLLLKLKIFNLFSHSYVAILMLKWQGYLKIENITTTVLFGLHKYNKISL